MNVLFVGDHPDDIETFCGGTSAIYAEQGPKVYFCVATNGNVGSSTLSKEEIVAVRHQEAHNGAGIIDAELIRLDFDDEFQIDSVETRHVFIEAFRISLSGCDILPLSQRLQPRPLDFRHDRGRVCPHGLGSEH